MKFKYKVLILLIFSLVSVIFVWNDYYIYKTPILRITDVQNTLQKDSSSREEYYEQKITGIIKNGKYKGNTYTTDNIYSYSGVDNDQYRQNMELLVNISKDGKHISKIIDIKRDKYIVFLLVFFIDLLLLITFEKGLKILLSLLVNVVISMIAIFTFKNNYDSLNMLLLYIGISVLFIVSSLFISNGKHKKTLAAIISSILALFISFSLAFVLVKIYGKSIELWTMDYIDMVFDYENFFYVSILLCGLGAIMDIAITISASLSELIDKKPKIRRSELIESGKEISKDIVGTMVNVMLYTCYAPIIPMVFLAVKNRMPLLAAFNNYGSLDLIIILCSCISIVLAIPISLWVSVSIFKPKNREVVK